MWFWRCEPDNVTFLRCLKCLNGFYCTYDTTVIVNGPYKFLHSLGPHFLLFKLYFTIFSLAVCCSYIDVISVSRTYQGLSHSRDLLCWILCQECSFPFLPQLHLPFRTLLKSHLETTFLSSNSNEFFLLQPSLWHLLQFLNRCLHTVYLHTTRW